jgi:hypothetical protein
MRAHAKNENCHIVHSLTMVDFYGEATINHKNKTVVNPIVLLTTSVFFSSFKIRHLVAQTVNLVKMAPCESWLTLASQISALHRAMLTQKNTLAGVEYKLNDNITRFTLSTFSELLVAPIIMVGADENSI